MPENGKKNKQNKNTVKETISRGQVKNFNFLMLSN